MAQEETFHYVRTSTLPFYERMCKSMLKSKLRKHRRVVSLLMAIVMVFAFMSMTASAATIEIPTITPKASTCPQCGGLGFTYVGTTVDTSQYYNRDIEGYHTCASCAASHAHYWVPATVKSRCATCGYTETYTYYVEYCPYGG